MNVDQAPVRVEDAVAAAFSRWSCSLRFGTLAPAVQRAAIDEVLDFIGDGIAGRAAAGMPAWLDVILDDGGSRSATLFGGGSASAWTAAMANGYLGHVLELDDTHDVAVLHAGASAIPAAIAAAQYRGHVDGALLLEGIVAGIELTCRLGVATDLSLVEGGWIYSALLGHFGAALAAAHVLGLDEPGRRNALGIVYCFACGNHQSSREGAPTKHLQPGIAAGNGVKAALMAARGLTGVHAPFTGEDGMARTYLRGRFDPQRAIDRLGREFETARLSIKPYPSCRLTHPAVSAALELRAKLGSDLEHVETVTLHMGSQAHDVVGRDEEFRRAPTRWLDAQFSVFWTVAVALCHGSLGPRHLFNEVPPSAALSTWIARIRAQAVAGSASRDVGACRIDASGPFGTVSIDAPQAKGHPDNPLSTAELDAKFAANVALAGIAAAAAHGMVSTLRTLHTCTDIAPLVAIVGRAIEVCADGGSPNVSA